MDDATQQMESEKDSISVPSMKEKDADGKSWERAKRAVFPVPQTDSDAAKGNISFEKFTSNQYNLNFGNFQILGMCKGRGTG